VDAVEPGNARPGVRSGHELGAVGEDGDCGDAPMPHHPIARPRPTAPEGWKHHLIPLADLEIGRRD
jgi:hypothetical protein